MSCLNGCLGSVFGAIIGIAAAFIYEFFVFPRLVGGVNWDAAGPAPFMRFTLEAIILGLLGAIIGAFWGVGSSED